MPPEARQRGRDFLDGRARAETVRDGGMNEPARGSSLAEITAERRLQLPDALARHPEILPELGERFAVHDAPIEDRRPPEIVHPDGTIDLGQRAADDPLGRVPHGVQGVAHDLRQGGGRLLFA